MIYIKVSKIGFNCPYCSKSYSDDGNIYLNRINKNTSFITKKKCSCGQRFGITYDIKGDIVSFKLENKNELS